MTRPNTRKKIITLCSSAFLFKEVLELEKELKKIGFRVKVPKTAKRMQRENNFDVNHYKTWFNDKSDYNKKRKLMKDHFKKVIESDAVLVLNKEKNGVQGYIGGNGLMEMTIALHYKKPIFIYENIAEDLPIAEEIYGLGPVFIDKNLDLIAKKLK
jgi:beta-glucosidase/6-phospho-beta-glucosidase/beta-galactosidase